MVCFFSLVTFEYDFEWLFFVSLNLVEIAVVSDLSVLSTGITEEVVDWLEVSNGIGGGGDWVEIGAEDRRGDAGEEACTIKDKSVDFGILNSDMSSNMSSYNIEPSTFLPQKKFGSVCLICAGVNPASQKVSMVASAIKQLPLLLLLYGPMHNNAWSLLNNEKHTPEHKYLFKQDNTHISFLYNALSI